MNDTHKLLLAFIEASGYEVKEDKYVILSDGTRYECEDTDWCKEIYSPELHVDYKVTKKDPGPSKEEI